MTAAVFAARLKRLLAAIDAAAHLPADCDPEQQDKRYKAVEHMGARLAEALTEWVEQKDDAPCRNGRSEDPCLSGRGRLP